MSSSDPRFVRRRRAFWFWFLATALLSVSLGVLLWKLWPGWSDPARSWSLEGREFSLVAPELLLSVLLLPALLFVAGRSLADLPRWLRVLSLGLRVAFVAALALSLGQVLETEKNSKICGSFLLDVSESMSDAAVESGRERFLELARNKREGDSLSLLVFAEDVSPVDWDSPGRSPSLPDVAALRARVRLGATDLERALSTSRAYSGEDCLARSWIFSDGVETRGDVAAELTRQAQSGARIGAFRVESEAPADWALLDVNLPDDVTVGETFEVKVVVRSTQRSSAKISLFQGELLNGLDAARELREFQGTTTLAFRSVVRVGGPVVYRALVQTTDADTFPQNDEVRSRLEVPGPPRVLLVDGQPQQATYLAQLLSAQQFDVDVRAPTAFPASRAELEEFSFVVLSDVPYAAWSRNAEDLLIAYVRAGGGLLYVGGEAAYGPGGWQGSALEKILPVRMDDEKKRETPGVALSLVIDRSGSMVGLPLEMAKEACNATLGILQGTDLFEVIAFDTKPVRYVKMQPARYRSRIQNEVLRIQPGGGTEIFASLDMAYQDLLAVEARKKHIILLTDGNAGTEGIYDLVSTAFADGITVTSVGLGSGVNEELLRMIAEGGGGRYHAAAEPSSLPRIFTRETEMVSRQAAVEDWFPVHAVGAFEFLRGVPLAEAPLLRGYTRVQLGVAPSEPILVSEAGDPLLARRRVGLGKTLAWTSDFKTRWATDWLRWKRVGQFLGQLVRAHQRSASDREIPMTVELSGDEAVARFDAYDAEERFDSAWSSTLRAQSDRGAGAAGSASAQLTTNFRLVAPGRYEARLRLPEFGSYTFSAEHRKKAEGRRAEVTATSRFSLAYPYPEEFKSLEPRPQASSDWARMGRGAFEPTGAQAFDPGEDHKSARKERHSWFILAALVLFLLDLAVRRVRLG